MYIPRYLLEQLVFVAGAGSRFTQDSPIMPDVWFGYGRHPWEAMDLLMEPRRGKTPAQLSAGLRKAARRKDSVKTGVIEEIAYEESRVVARCELDALIRVVLPLAGWWDTHAGQLGGLSAASIEKAVAGKKVAGMNECGVWFLKLAGALLWARDEGSHDPCDKLPETPQYSKLLAATLKGLRSPAPAGVGSRALLWSINRNRDATVALWASTKTIKADAATQIFSLRCDHLAWAVLDTGIDAEHPAFRKRTAAGKLRSKNKANSELSRVVATYDFTKIRKLLSENPHELPEGLGSRPVGRAAELRKRLLAGQAIDWELLEKMLQVEHGTRYRPPVHAHGTHVAGILAADWRVSDKGYDAHEEHNMTGVCPDINLFDFRVLDQNGEGDEFSIIAALQFIRYLNSRNRRPVIQGVNLSLAIPHDVSNYACGRTPVCEEAGRLVASGVVVVAAAGNEGYVHYLTKKGEMEAYRNISITDPGNSEPVITVGATHRRHPHTFGVSYFSSRGPTGDGRVKPDVVAPGEKIKAPVPGGGSDSMDGTSMAAPHVSGAAALIMSRYAEFIGAPDRIKNVLCDTATDLGREPYFQGSGVVDVCRALQSL